MAKHDRGILGECIEEERKSPYLRGRYACEPSGVAFVDDLTVRVSVADSVKVRFRDDARWCEISLIILSIVSTKVITTSLSLRPRTCRRLRTHVPHEIATAR